jgi:protein TonB
MAFHVTSVYRPALVLGVSAIVHGAAFFAPRAHAGGATAGALQASTLEIQVDPALPSDALEDTPSLDRGSPAPMQARPHAVHDRSPVARAQGPAPTVTPAAVATDGPMPHFALAISTQAVAVPAVSIQPSAAPDLARTGAGSPPSGDVDDSVPFAEQGVDTPARLVQSETPTYPADARAEGVEADVKLEMVVSREGAVESVRAVRSSGYGLDEAATRAARRFRFAPAVKYGRPVRARVSWTMQFRLR